MKLPFFTVGHSNLSFEGFVGLLSGADIGLVADIRRVPRSRANPQFNKDALPDALAAFHISYEHVEALGGLRGKTRTLPPDVNGFWANRSFHNYADYALSEHFAPASTTWSNRDASVVVRSCVQKPYGGGVTGASSPII